MFIVRGKPDEPAGSVSVIKETRRDALETANDFLSQGIPFVTIIADDRTYTVEEFALSIINDNDSDTPSPRGEMRPADAIWPPFTRGF